MGLHTEMRLLLIHWLFPLSLAAAAAVAELTPTPLAKPGCPHVCGNLSIPYPFGTRKGCFLDDNFLITCNATTNKPFLTDGNIEVLDISLDGQLRIFSWAAYDCYDKNGNQLSYFEPWTTLSKFTLSFSRNMFIAVGCDSYAWVRDYWGDTYATGCLSICYTNDSVVNGSCSGIGCCQTSIPKGVKNFNITVTSYNNHTRVMDFNPCSYAFVVEDGIYKFSTLDLVNFQKEGFPVVLDWAIGNKNCKEARKNTTAYACKENSVCLDSDNQPGYLCNCSSGYKGNPYLANGCKGASSAVSLLFVIISFVSWGLQRRKINELKKKNFRDNGGPVLKQLLSKIERTAEKAKIFTEDEVKKATNNFNASQIVGKGGFGIVYKGTLDKKLVAIKKSRFMDHDQIEQFVNEKRKEPTGQDVSKIAIFVCCNAGSSSCTSFSSNPSCCPNQCGNLSISFPFGTKEGCYLNEDFLITCNASNAAFLGITKIEVLNISVQGQLRISIEAAYDCYNEAGNITRRARSILSVPKFPLSYRQNKFTATGCDTSTLIQGKRAHTYATGCVSYCVKHEDVINGSCAGIGCCQTSIPKGVLNFRASVGSFSDHQNVWNFNPCSYAFVVEEKAYDFSVLDLADLRGVTKFPVVLDWAIGNETCSDAQKKPETYACKDNSICHDSDNGPGYRCNCSDGYSGNPYLANGCKGTYAIRLQGYKGDGRKDGIGCTRIKKSHIGIAIGVGIGVIVLLVASSWLYLVLKERKLIKLKEKFFRQNGGFMLKQKLCSPEGTSNATKLFTAEELKRATNNYDESTIIGKAWYEGYEYENFGYCN
ncbi:hypothetical protein GH714_022148 [Hevea brasiliensis]|uniref:EGF-like domain-containing protein n=1 Tax=Hevea brasiliensis TaxID=3981 RepID=A0A6A6KTJ6_HEVBR|nr:hypothetical protein GH714_022148 [Hevea brasiliensis]